MDEALHGSARTPAEMPTYQQTHAIARLKFDDFESVELDEIPQDLALREPIGACDIGERRSIDYQPSD
jgi:hypothetical protein